MTAQLVYPDQYNSVLRVAGTIAAGNGDGPSLVLGVPSDLKKYQILSVTLQSLKINDLPDVNNAIDVLQGGSTVVGHLLVDGVHTQEYNVAAAPGVPGDQVFVRAANNHNISYLILYREITRTS
jgi:hypothetical protein